MSTKIHNGYQLQNKTTFADLNLFCQKLGEQISKKREELVEQLFSDLFMNDIVSIFSGDYLYFEKVNLKRNIVFCLSEICENEQNKIKTIGARNPRFDFDFEVVFIHSSQKILCLLYTEKREFVNIWESQPGVEEYGYWNNSDKPENLSEKDWDKREIDWDEALPGYTPPSKRGLVYIPDDKYIFGIFNNEFKKMLSKKEALRKLSQSLLRQWWVKKHKDLYNLKSQRLSYYIGFFNALENFIKTKDSKKLQKRYELKANWRLKNWNKIIESKTYQEVFEFFWEI